MKEEDARRKKCRRAKWGNTANICFAVGFVFIRLNVAIDKILVIETKNPKPHQIPTYRTCISTYKKGYRYAEYSRGIVVRHVEILVGLTTRENGN